MDRGAAGESYMLAGPRMPLADGLRMVASIAGTPGPIVLPTAVVRATAGLVGVVEKLVPLPPSLGAETMRAGVATYYGTPARAERELGWTCRPPETGLRETVEALRA
jgi:dihydroflavonol-4-reductase